MRSYILLKKKNFLVLLPNYYFYQIVITFVIAISFQSKVYICLESELTKCNNNNKAKREQQRTYDHHNVFIYLLFHLKCI